MRLFLLFALALCPLFAAPTIDDVVDQARQSLRRKSPPTARPLRTADVPAPHWSPAAAAAGTLILLTATAMAFTSLLLELGFPWRPVRRVRIRWRPSKAPWFTPGTAQ